MTQILEHGISGETEVTDFLKQYTNAKVMDFLGAVVAVNKYIKDNNLDGLAYQIHNSITVELNRATDKKHWPKVQEIAKSFYTMNKSPRYQTLRPGCCYKKRKASQCY